MKGAAASGGGAEWDGAQAAPQGSAREAATRMKEKIASKKVTHDDWMKFRPPARTVNDAAHYASAGSQSLPLASQRHSRIERERELRT